MKNFKQLLSILALTFLIAACGKVTGKDEVGKESNTSGVLNPNSPEGSAPGAPPAYVSHNRVNPSLIEVSLTKELNTLTGTNVSNFIFNNGLQAVSVAKKSGEPTTLQITTTTQQQINYTLTMLGLTTIEGVNLTGVIQITFEGLPSPAITSVAWKDPAATTNPLPASAYGISLCQLSSGAGAVCTASPFYNRTGLHGVLTGGAAVAYRYKVDAGAWSSELPIATPFSVSGLAEGYHTVYFIGKHANGYWQSESASDVFTLSYVQDSVAPDAYIDPLTYPASVTASTTFNVRVIGTDVSYFLYCLDNSATSDCTSGSWQGTTSAPLASAGYGLPIGTYPGTLQPGSVRIRVRGIDASGNAQASFISGGEYTWVVDTGTVEAIFNTTDLASLTTTGTTASVRVTNAGGAVAFKGKIVSGTDCNAGTTWDLLPEVTNLATPISASGLAANGGYYTVCAVGKSLGNNWQGGWNGTNPTVSVVTKYSWVVDTTAPTASVTWLTTPYAYPGSSPSITETSYQWQVSTSDGVTHYRYAIVSGAGSPCSGATFGAETPVSTLIDFTAASTGVNTYKLCVIARDAAGNYQLTSAASTEGEWTVDKDPPANNPSFASVSQSARSFSVPVVLFDIDNSTAPSDAYYYKIEVAKDTAFTAPLVSNVTVESCKSETSVNCPTTLGTRTVTVTIDPFTQGAVYARIQAGDKQNNFRSDYSAASAEHFVVGKITGTVKNIASGAVAGVTVRILDSDGTSLAATYPDQTSDASGNFTFDNIRTAKNRYRLLAAPAEATYYPAMKQQTSVQPKGASGTIATPTGIYTLVAKTSVTSQNVVAKIVDGDDGWGLGYAQVSLLDYTGAVVGTAQRSTYTNNGAFADCDDVSPVGNPPTNLPKTKSTNASTQVAHICGDVVFPNVAPGTYTISVNGKTGAGGSWDAGNQSYNDLLQENIVVPGLQESPFLLVRGGGSTGSTIYDPGEHKVRAGPTIMNQPNAPPNAGAHALVISSGPLSGKFLFVRGGATTTTRVFSTNDRSSSMAGPALSANAGAGAHSFAITSGLQSGKFLIIHGNGVSTTSLFDPVTNTIVAGPGLVGTAGNNAGAGANSFTVPSGTNAGKTLVIQGGATTNTSLYDPATHTFSAGPALPVAANDGAFNLSITSGTQSGKIRIVLANTNNTAVYDPAFPANFAVGSTLSATAGIGANAFNITAGTHSGKTLFVHGGGATTTSLYDPATDSFGVGPALSAAAGAGANNFNIPTGTHSGKQFVVLGNNTAATSLYDPAAGTFSAGLTLTNPVNTSGFTLQLTRVAAGRLPLVRTLTGQDLKVILSWGAGDPVDLDMHVVGTLPSGQTLTNVNNDDCGTANNTFLHVWAARPNVGLTWQQQYSAKTRTYIQGNAAYNTYNYFPTDPNTTTALVQDTNRGFGPEAINFIGGYTDGTYWFSVANWSGWKPSGGADKINQQWDVTNVEIKVYDATGLAYQMTASAPTTTPDFTDAASQAGCSSTSDWQQCELWRAFKMTVSGSGSAGRIYTPVNQYANWTDNAGNFDENKCKMGGSW